MARIAGWMVTTWLLDLFFLIVLALTVTSRCGSPRGVDICRLKPYTVRKLEAYEAVHEPWIKFPRLCDTGTDLVGSSDRTFHVAV